MTDTTLTTRPTPEAQEARDAARYRWLRECDQEQEDMVMLRKNCGCGGDELLFGEQLDAAIDAARRARGEG